MSYLEERRKHIEAGRPLKPKKVYTISKKSAKQIQKEKEQETVIVKPKKSGWFDANGAISKEAIDEIANGTGIAFPTALDFALQPKPKDEMDTFWKNAEKVIAKTKKCWECGDFISPSDYRNSTAHIFPKSENSGFPSVASNEWNFVVAGVRCGCHNKTHRLDTFSQMSIFPTAVARFHKFSHLITEKKKYLDLFVEYANKII
jgi:hypothetical protein